MSLFGKGHTIMTVNLYQEEEAMTVIFGNFEELDFKKLPWLTQHHIYFTERCVRS